ncbi:MAG: M36 family metallopeptidase [Pseudomonadota bacterium]
METTPKHLFAMPALVAALMSAGLALAQAPLALDRSAAQVTRAAAGRALTAPSAAAPADIVAGHLRGQGRANAVLASLRTVRSGAGAHGVTHLRIEQVVDGLTVHGAYLKAAVNARGELVHVIDRLAAVSAPAPSRIDALTALRTAMASVHPTQSMTFHRSGEQGNVASFDGGAFFHTRPTVTAVAVPMSDGTLARGWLVQTWTQQANQLHHTLVSGDGRVLDIENRTASDSYNVFAEDPLKGPQTVVQGPAAGSPSSPAGWLGSGAQTTINITGNNANVYLDADKNNRADRGGSAVADGNFVTAANLAAAPTTTANQAVSVQNLFYLNNVVHDILYGHGFNEAAGNFQIDNFGKGGAGGDPVLAEAQDGGGLDNANFATPADGKKPRMQMYLWSGNGPTHEVRVNSPGVTSYAAKGAEFGPAMTTTGITGAVVTTVPADGCTAISGSLSGKVALIDRGACNFTVKALNAQAAGATAMIVANTDPTIFVMGGAERRVKIPSVMINQNDGNALKGTPAPNATVRKLAQQPLQLDGSIDADIVFHEYGHGLSWRMIGGMSGPLAGAIGEGNSDAIAMLINGDPVIGEYSYGNPNGIRRYRYDSYPLTYGDVTGAEVHNDGEIYAAIIWRMMTLFDTNSRSRGDLFRYVVDGMNTTPSTPTYEQMREGILASVSAGPVPADCSLVWQAFAQYGVGVGALGVVNSSTSVTITPSFNVPASCN